MSSDFELLEPVLAVDEIQGNILVGFNKDHQAVLPLHFAATPAAAAAVRTWLRDVVASLTWLRELAGERRARRAFLQKTGREPPTSIAVLQSLAFSWQGLRKLTLEADAFEPLFKDGLSPLAPSD